jgi:hypothetical protein
MNGPLKIGFASVLALSAAAPAAYAQYQPAPQYRPTPQYQRDLGRYQSDRAAYDAQRGNYQVARREYESRLANYERARANYDTRYGYGAYARIYGPAPVWDEAYWSGGYTAPGYAAPGYTAPGYAYGAPGYGYAAPGYAYGAPGYGYSAPSYGYGTPGYVPAYGAPGYVPPSAGYYGRDTAYTGNVRCDNNSTVTAGILGALAGAALGSNVAARNARTEGAVLGGVVGAGLGVAVGRANDRYKCDTRGPYYAYNETVPYRESSGYGTGNSSYYNRMRCRLAAAPIDSYARDYRYIRVCPDASGRYRITG